MSVENNGRMLEMEEISQSASSMRVENEERISERNVKESQKVEEKILELMKRAP